MRTLQSTKTVVFMNVTTATVASISKSACCLASVNPRPSTPPAVTFLPISSRNSSIIRHCFQPRPLYPTTLGQVYLVYHNDETCSNLAGLQSLIVGDTELITTDDSISCQDSMACLIQPNGSTCQAIPVEYGQFGLNRISHDTFRTQA
jgi:hypothetical protein